MTRVMVSKLFTTYFGESIQLYFAGPRTTPMLIIKLADGRHRIERVVDVVDLGPTQPAVIPPQTLEPQLVAAGEVQNGQAG